MRIFTVISVLLLQLGFLSANNPKLLDAKRIDDKIVIDGLLTDEAWINAHIAEDFTQNEPDPGTPAEHPTYVRVIYDNGAVYIGAELKYPNPSNIYRELTLRNRFGKTDFFAIILSPYKDWINGVSFGTTAAGVQIDTKFSSEGTDRSWNAVWESEVRINEDGWSIEMSIPYSAIRFSENPQQEWQINFERHNRKTREVSFWSEVDPAQSGFLDQGGLLHGIENIQPPVRLSATPFLVLSFSGQNEENGQSWDTDISGGLDVKYGINDAFTLDMTLVPDFSQARSDDEVLNLSPFEVRFDENRDFFKEGVDLFDKGGYFIQGVLEETQ